MYENNTTREVIIQRRAKRVLRQLPKDLLNSIAATIDRLAQYPPQLNNIRFRGHDNLYRIYVEGWRIIYTLEDKKPIILILETSPLGRGLRKR
jgi:mRNA-degrading endonuclease RelE of RelBE toxin-antitoxin system